MFFSKANDIDVICCNVNSCDFPRIRTATGVGFSSPLGYITSGFGIIDGLHESQMWGGHWIRWLHCLVWPRCALIPAFAYAGDIREEKMFACSWRYRLNQISIMEMQWVKYMMQNILLAWLVRVFSHSLVIYCKCPHLLSLNWHEVVELQSIT